MDGREQLRGDHELHVHHRSSHAARFAVRAQDHVLGSREAAKECSPRRKRMRKKSRMRAPPWKSGASAPRKRFEINAGFSPGGYSPSDGGLFPHPRKPWVPRVEPASPEGAKEKLRHRLRRACPEQAKRAEGDGIRSHGPLKTTGKEETCLKQKGLKNHLNI